MAQIEMKQNPLVMNPLKVGQSVGASLVFLGLERTMPLQHGARGCTSFNKLFFMRHFREPIPLQTTAMELTTVIMGADANVVEALRVICERYHPAVIGLSTTGLSATQGASLQHSLKEFRQEYPEYADTEVVPVETCDSQGGLETGYALALLSILKTLKPSVTSVKKNNESTNRISLIPSSMMTPEDVDAIKCWIEQYGFRVTCLPDISLSIDGNLQNDGYNPLTQGGTSCDEIRTIGQSQAVITIGQSLTAVADWCKENLPCPVYSLKGLHSLADCDQMNLLLSQISQKPVPPIQRRQRTQLLDTMLDTQFRLGVSRLAIACESDLMFALCEGLNETGCEIVTAVIPSLPLNGITESFYQQVRRLNTQTLHVSDLGMFEEEACQNHAELLITNSHGVELSARTGIPLMPVGYPLHKHSGGHAQQWVGYHGIRQTLYRIDNLLSEGQQTIAPYRSSFWPRRDSQLMTQQTFRL